ncbi:DUF6883 domain-containing protein [Thermodesulfovibrio yellowstonii]|uniref:DUF6883 domain-containing protein n=1 Tax=Thermodesulfovibrio yellowstonii TaxID=28262 RepID=A0A9W6LJL9_9BACT|nr:DUF6883 domain-containing protein [Thermodesulfovibrio islandicus]GLI52684.1 hypothetical protein TISLANDTSLP1_03770 [Thermodesulfovibrio islandicus]
MKLSNYEKALIDNEKILNYLLSETHPVGKFKAKFFRSLGFNANNADLLKNALLQIACDGTVTKAIDTPFGVKYIIEGFLPTPIGQTVNILTVWIIEKGEKILRFVTAYPK